LLCDVAADEKIMSFLLTAAISNQRSCCVPQYASSV